MSMTVKARRRGGARMEEEPGWRPRGMEYSRVIGNADYPQDLYLAH
jgi:hypothetical protein